MVSCEARTLKGRVGARSIPLAVVLVPAFLSWLQGNNIPRVTHIKNFRGHAGSDGSLRL